MSLSLRRQEQLLELFETMVHSAEDELDFRKQARQAITSRDPYKTLVKLHEEAQKITDELKPIALEAFDKMDSVMRKFNKVAKENTMIYMNFWKEKIENPVDLPEVHESEGFITLAKDGTGRNPVLDKEPIGDAEFRSHVETLRSSLKLAITERELIQALTDAKASLQEYMAKRKQRKE